MAPEIPQEEYDTLKQSLQYKIDRWLALPGNLLGQSRRIPVIRTPGNFVTGDISHLQGTTVPVISEDIDKIRSQDHIQLSKLPRIEETTGWLIKTVTTHPEQYSIRYVHPDNPAELQDTVDILTITNGTNAWLERRIYLFKQRTGRITDFFGLRDEENREATVKDLRFFDDLLTDPKPLFSS